MCGRLSVLAACMSLWIPAAVARGDLPPAYRVTVIASASELRAGGLSENGRICYNIVINGRSHAYQWYEGSVVPLASLEGLDRYGTYARDVNDLGLAVGYQGPTPAIWDQGTGQAAAQWSTDGGELFAINASGDYAGFGEAEDSTMIPMAFCRLNGVDYDIASLLNLTVSKASDISDTGFVVGVAGESSPGTGFRFHDGQARLLPSLAPGRSQDMALAVNDMGIVVGRSGLTAAAIWTDEDTVQPLWYSFGAYSNANDINNANQVVGYRGATPVIWEEGQLVDINSLIEDGTGLTLTIPLRINDEGQILSYAEAPGSSDRALVLLNPVPEPSVLCAIALGAAAILKRRT